MGQNSIRGSEQVEITINHPKFLQAKIYTQSTREILKTTFPSDQKAYKLWKELLEKYKSIHHSNLLLSLKHKFISSGVCAIRGSVEAHFDNHPYLLTEEIYNRRGSKNPFTETELWYLLYAFLSAKNFLLQNTEYPYTLIGDIRPDNVFINKNGEVKFSNLLSWPGQKINYKKTFDGITTYLSPQDYELLQLGSMNNEKNQQSEFFSIGFTLVSAAILRQNSDIYNIEKQRFDHNEAKKRINTFKCLTVYSQLLRGIISSFCQFEPKRRIQFSDLWLWITKYESRILLKQSFLVDEVPPKINQHINVLRTEILALQPGSSTLNLNSIKSLRGSQAKNQATFAKKIPEGQLEKSQVKYLKEVQKTTSQIQTEKRKSKIIINTSQNQRVFYSPNNPAYYASHAPEGSQISQLRSKLAGQQGSRIQSFYSPPRQLQAGNSQYEGQKVVKSPEGFYSPKSGNQKFRVFIQYKSPPKPIQKPYAETIYLGKEGQQQSVVVVKSMDQGVKKNDSDSKSQKSQKSGGSNRQNRFIEETKRETDQSNKVAEILNKEIKSEIYKKQSPIHQIIDYEQLNQIVSEVVSEEVIMPNDKSEQRLQNVNEIPQCMENSQSIQLVQEEKVKCFNNEIEQYQSGKVNQEQVQSQTQKDKQNQLLQQIKLSESDQIRLKTQEEVNELTFDNGDDIIPPQKEKDQVSPFQQITNEIFPHSLENSQQQQNQQNIPQPQQTNQQPQEQNQTSPEIDTQTNEANKIEHQTQSIEQLNQNNVPQIRVQPMIQQHLSAEDIIDNEISSEKEPQNSFHGSRHSDMKLDDNFVTLNAGTNQDNILILDEPADSEIQNECETHVDNQQNAQDNNQQQQQQQNLQQVESDPVEKYESSTIENNNEEITNKDEHVTRLQQRPLIPLGPQIHDQRIVESPIYELETLINIHEEEKQQVPMIQQSSEILKAQKKKPQSPFEQIQLQSPFEQIQQQDLSQFHSSHIAQIIEIHPNIVSIEQDSLNLSKNQPQQPLQHQNISSQPQFQFNSEFHQHETEDYKHSKQLENEENDENDEEIVCNVIQVNDISNPLDNGVDKDSEIQESGDFNLIDRNQNFVDFQQTERVLIPQVLYQEQLFTFEPQNNQITIEQVGQKVVGDIQFVFDDPFLKDVQQTNKKLNEIKEQQEKLKENDGIEKEEQANEAVQERNAQSKEILPVQSNQKLSLYPMHQQQVQPSQAQIQQAKTQPTPLQTQNIQTQPHPHELPSQENYLHFSNLQVSLPRAPTQSEFGNISEIMDINKVFNNTLNSKERNFLEATADPRSEEFLKELINLSQKGAIQQSDLQKVHMSRQDRNRLTSFMKRWQQFKSQNQQNAQQYIDEFREAITRSQNANSLISQEDQQAKLHMSAQDKETLKLVIQKLNTKKRTYLEQLQQSPVCEKKIPANYDQSYVEIKYSELKLEQIVGQKDEEKQKKERQIQAPQVKPFLNIGEGHDILDEMIQINKVLNQQNVHQEGQQFALQSAPVNQQANNNVNHPQEQHPHYEAATQIQQLVDQQVDNFQFKHENGSQVHASVGEKSEREDPLNMQVDLNKITQNQTVENLTILTNHRTYSQPNDFFQRGTLSEDLSPRSNKHRHVEHKNTITEEFQENQELTEILPENVEEQVQNSQLTHNKLKDFIEQITVINGKIKNQVEAHIEPISIEQIKVPTPVIVEPIKLQVQKDAPVARRSPRTVRKGDFLDEVMQVNRIINREENKDYSKGNKYLHEQNQGN